jgi:hypothetical protein
MNLSNFIKTYGPLNTTFLAVKEKERKPSAFTDSESFPAFLAGGLIFTSQSKTLLFSSPYTNSTLNLFPLVCSNLIFGGRSDNRKGI